MTNNQQSAPQPFKFNFTSTLGSAQKPVTTEPQNENEKPKPAFTFSVPAQAVSFGSFKLNNTEAGEKKPAMTFNFAQPKKEVEKTEKVKFAEIQKVDEKIIISQDEVEYFKLVTDEKGAESWEKNDDKITFQIVQANEVKLLIGKMKMQKSTEVNQQEDGERYQMIIKMKLDGLKAKKGKKGVQVTGQNFQILDLSNNNLPSVLSYYIKVNEEFTNSLIENGVKIE
ncbi:Hypothetical_protein [Hexamita inflata]|uniref:Hypothetical_protein n=1 Tax=Hexamita inflata TaxID=28002 RepID=A0AA86R3R8_9EUKA|nr:Hypothetical protein HINF_LOCUS26873 [Hexamita inflata]CAI9965567.1 Hypothetical protein HINF_LOCUS53212 [Hexamita inflata]